MLEDFSRDAAGALATVGQDGLICAWRAVPTAYNRWVTRTPNFIASRLNVGKSSSSILSSSNSTGALEHVAEWFESAAACFGRNGVLQRERLKGGVTCAVHVTCAGSS